jgi:hypothetical protein
MNKILFFKKKKKCSALILVQKRLINKALNVLNVTINVEIVVFLKAIVQIVLI